MCHVCRVTLAAGLTVALVAPLSARPEDDAKTRPASPRVRADALYRYAVGLLQQRDDRLVTATKTLEEAVRLDPEAIHPRVELIDLYVALGRPDDAAKTAAAVVAMAPAWEDAKHRYGKVGKVWLVLARLRQELGQSDDAVATLWQCVKHPDLANQPAARAAAACEIGRLLEATHAEAAVTAYRLAVSLYATISVGAASPAEIAEAAEGMGRAAVKFAKDPKVTAADRTKLYADADAAFDLARTEFNKAGTVDRAARIDFHQATVALARKDWGKSESLLQKYLARRPRDADAYALYARVLREYRDSETAGAMLQAAARDMPDFMPLRLLLAEAYRVVRSDLAEQEYRKVIEKVADVAAYHGLITLQKKTGRSNEIRSDLESLFNAAMPDGRTVTNEKAAERARAMISALRQEPAIVRDLLNLVVNDVGYRGFNRGRGFGRGPQPPPRAFDGVLVLGELAESTRQLDTAEELFRGHLVDFNQRGFGGRGGRNGMVSPGTLDMYFGLIRALRAGHKHEEVVQVCRDGLDRQDAMTPYLNYFMAASLMRLGKGAEALAAAQVAIDSLNDAGLRLSTRLLRLEVLAFLGRYDQAIADGRKLLDSEDFAEADEVKQIRLALANVYSEARQFEPAEALLRAALDLAPDDATLHNALGYHLADQGRKLDEAERLIRRALELDQVEKRRRKDKLAAEEENSAFLDSLGWVLFRKGRLTEARDYLKKACDFPEGNGDPVVWDHLGDVHVRLGSAVEAERAWKRARDLYDRERRSQDNVRGAEVIRKLERLKK